MSRNCNNLMSRVFELVLFGSLMLLPFVTSSFRVALFGKYLSYSIAAVGIVLLWGYTGILSLGQAVFFGLGAYALGMYLKLEASNFGLTDFMQWCGLEKLPLLWVPFKNVFIAILLGILIPALLAGALGYFTFKRNIKDVYFTLITQALAVIFVTLFIGQQPLTGGTNGLTNFKTFLGISLKDEKIKMWIYYLTLAVVIVLYVVGKVIVKKYGNILIAIRDNEERLKYLGINPLGYKIDIYIFSAILAAIGGMLFVLNVGMISPSEMGIIPSIELVLGVAIGGKVNLLGGIVGTVVAYFLKSIISENYPDIWLYLLGVVFVIISLIEYTNIKLIKNIRFSKFKKTHNILKINEKLR